MTASFYAQLDRITALLRTRGRVSYRDIKRELGLDDELLAEEISIDGMCGVY